jgi:hypothetical protein
VPVKLWMPVQNPCLCLWISPRAWGWNIPVSSNMVTDFFLVHSQSHLHMTLDKFNIATGFL